MNNNFWKIRSEKYENLSWAKDESYMDALMRLGDFSKDEVVLDVGTGTGMVAKAIAPTVKKVIGLDLSREMMKKSEIGGNYKIKLVRGDIRCSGFKNSSFDKISARLVFHHIIEDTQKAMNECHRLLKKGGKMILAEGTPPNEQVKDDYIKIFSLKEDRLTFMKEDLVLLMENAGFEKIDVYTHLIRQMSVKNWLENSGLQKDVQDKIFNLHVNGSEVFKKSYNLLEEKGDCFIDIKNLIVVGEK